jgi:hypothetical protein
MAQIKSGEVKNVPNLMEIGPKWSETVWKGSYKSQKSIKTA